MRCAARRFRAATPMIEPPDMRRLSPAVDADGGAGSGPSAHRSPGRIVVAGGAPAARERLARRLAARWRVRLLDDTRDLPGPLRPCPNLVLVLVQDMDAETARLVRSLRGTRPGLTASIVLLAARPGPASALRAVAAGADELLPADVPHDELLLRLRARIDLARARARAARRERMARRAAADVARRRDEFLAVVSHELRTPLGAILIWTQLLRGAERQQAPDERALDMIERSARSLAQLIDDLLDVSRMVTGKLRVERRPIDLGAVVAAAVESARLGAEARGVELAARIAPDLPAVEGDPVRLQQVAANLISNAVKFTPREGRVEVTLSRHGHDMRLVVADTGVGIEPEFLPYVFERFTQADSTSTRRYKGLGLGLSIARHLVERHGGHIEAFSRGVDLGTTFTVTLPLAAREERPPDPPPAESEPAELEGLRVFLVDDEADARDAICLLLRQSGATVKAFGSAAEAFEAVKAERPHVLLSDIAMPGEDGYSLMQRLRALPRAQGGGVRAAALTAYAGAEDRARALAAGYDEHLVKPVDPAELIRAAARLGRGASSAPRHGGGV
jgi:signal transduction histidine kinase/ActR/RegA family two-component response regulator